MGRTCYHSDTGLRVLDNGLFRWLMFRTNVLQTVLFKPAPHKYGLYYIKSLTLAARHQPGDVCLLGLGGGGVVHTLAPCLQNYIFNAVEINAEVIDIARQFFKINSIDNFQVIQADALSYLLECRRKFKHIVVDLYDDSSFPANCFHEDFFKLCRQNLDEGGVLSINLANRQDVGQIMSWVCRLFNNEVITIIVKSCNNIVLLASLGSIHPWLLALQTTRGLSRLSWQANVGYVAEF